MRRAFIGKLGSSQSLFAYNFVCAFRMAAADSPKRLQRIDKTVLGWDRPTLLRTLGIGSATPLVGNFAPAKAASLEGKRPLKIHEDKVPFLDKGDALECCSGAKLVKWSYSLTTMPYPHAADVQRTTWVQPTMVDRAKPSRKRKFSIHKILRSNKWVTT